MSPSLSHDQCRAKMCCCCGVKLPKEQLISPKVELMVKMFGPNLSYSSTVASYPTGLCSSCNRVLYKIKVVEPEASWGGSHPPSWTNFSADGIQGVRTCGTLLEG